MDNPRDEDRLGRITALVVAASQLAIAVAMILRALGKIL
jgi:hypothetical protein